MKNQLKKALYLSFTMILLCNSAYALPGHKFKDTQSWIKNHKFLSTYYIGPLDGMGYWRIIAFRQLQDNVFLDIELTYSFNYARNDKNADLVEEALILTKREYNRHKEITDGFSDTRPWEDREYINIWARENQKTSIILTQVYGKEVADDFSKSKLLYTGPEYSEEYPGEYVREKIKQISQYRISIWTQNVQIFLGNKFGYEVSNVQLEGSPKRVSLKIRSKSEAIKDAELLKNNAKMYEEFLKKEENQNKRNSPADIKI